MSAEFFQDPPRLGNTFHGDAVLRSYLARRLPAAVRREVEPGLERLGGGGGGPPRKAAAAGARGKAKPRSKSARKG